ncbi:Bloom syndrome protein [Holothuria leucospilota]|uniref:DNA 3'-5' helicase n=1 Tax=Holothuria leucospilota TaxID=206669 RepID=A0A9Q1C655_HOLLE|nr:Bloom syndrome protein [Holothuria leucospilota]
MDTAQELGLEAGPVMNDFTEDVTENLSTGMYSILFASPEVLLSTKGREALQVGQVYDRICCIFVDESHCVVKWVHSSGHTNAFRKFYGMLAELRSVIKPSTPLIAMAATATTQVRAAIVKSLGMHNVALKHASGTVDNIKHVVVETRLKDPSEIFSWLCEDLKQKHGKMERVIIFCQSRKDCSELYSTFSSLLPTACWRYFNMFHTNTETDVQEEIAADFGNPDGTIRVLFTTIAFGLGIDVRGVQTIICLDVQLILMTMYSCEAGLVVMGNRVCQLY